MKKGGLRRRMACGGTPGRSRRDRKSTRLNSSHSQISYAVFCLKKKKNNKTQTDPLSHIFRTPERTRITHCTAFSHISLSIVTIQRVKPHSCYDCRAHSTVCALL